MMFHRKSNKREKAYGIIGLGRFGTALAQQLASAGKEILVIDANEDRVSELRDYTENAYVVKSLDKKSLEETGIQNCDVAVVCIGEQIDSSILAVLRLIGLGIPRVIAKASSTEHGEVLAKLGASVVYPERDMAIRLARSLEPSKIIDYMEIGDKIDISKVAVPGCLIGKTVQAVNFRSAYGLMIIAAEHLGDITTDIDPNFCFAQEDILYVMGNREKIRLFEQLPDA